MEQVSGNEEAFRRHKAYFAQYVESDESLLPDKIRALADSNSNAAKRLLIDINLLRVYDGAFTSGTSVFQRYDSYVFDLYRDEMTYLFNLM
jgi:DNA replication licensing factor MCM3